MTTTTDTRYIANVTRAEDLVPGDVVQLTAHGPKLTVGNAWVAHGTNDNPCVGIMFTGRDFFTYLPLGTFVKVDTVHIPGGRTVEVIEADRSVMDDDAEWAAFMHELKDRMERWNGLTLPAPEDMTGSSDEVAVDR